MLYQLLGYVASMGFVIEIGKGFAIILPNVPLTMKKKSFKSTPKRNFRAKNQPLYYLSYADDCFSYISTFLNSCY